MSDELFGLRNENTTKCMGCGNINCKVEEYWNDWENLRTQRPNERNGPQNIHFTKVEQLQTFWLEEVERCFKAKLQRGFLNQEP